MQKLAITYFGFAEIFAPTKIRVKVLQYKTKNKNTCRGDQRSPAPAATIHKTNNQGLHLRDTVLNLRDFFDHMSEPQFSPA